MGSGGGGEGGTGTRRDARAGHRTDINGGDGDQGERARPGSCPHGKRHKHAGGHTAVAEGGGSTRPYLEAPLNRRGNPDRLIVVLVQGPRGCS